jgi:hypothetical protein
VQEALGAGTFLSLFAEAIKEEVKAMDRLAVSYKEDSQCLVKFIRIKLDAVCSYFDIGKVPLGHEYFYFVFANMSDVFVSLEVLYEN